MILEGIAKARAAGRMFVLGAAVWMPVCSFAQVLPSGQPSVAEKKEFDVASVRQSRPGMAQAEEQRSNVPLGPGDVFAPTGGLFTAENVPLLTYIAFAYRMTDGQLQTFREMAPGWVGTDRFSIRARMEDRTVTKDQVRLMMRALLAERFKLAVHYETRQIAVFALVPLKPGVTGPKLQPQPADATCSKAPPGPGTADAAPTPEQPETVSGGFPTICGGILGLPASAPDRYSFGARDVGMSLLANSLTSWGNLGRPVVDKTGLVGNYRFVLDFTPESFVGANGAVSSGGPTFREALKEQLGLKLESEKGEVQVLVLDHVEHLTEN